MRRPPLRVAYGANVSILETPPLSPAPPTSADRREVLATLAGYGRSECAARLSVRLADRLAVAGLLLLAPVVADHLVSGGAPLGLLRAGAAAWGLGTLSALVAALRGAMCQHWHPLHLARQVERDAGIPHNLLVNCELLDRSERYRYAGPEAARAAASALRAAQSAGIRWLPALPARRILLPLALVVAVWVLFALIADKSVLRSLGRMFGAAWDAPTAVRIEWVEPGPGRAVYAGEPLEMSFACHGPRLGAARLELLATPYAATAELVHALVPLGRRDGADWFHIELAAHEVSRDLAFRVRAGDGALTAVVPVRALPALESVTVAIEPPRYSGRARRELPAERLEPVLRDSRLRFEATGSVPMHDAIFAFRPLQSRIEQRTGLTPGVEPTSATVELKAVESGEFWIEFDDENGRRAADARRFELTVHADQPPEVTALVGAGSSLDAPVDLAAEPLLRVQARDDVGLTAVELVLQRQGLAQRMALAEPAGGDTSRIEIDVPALGLPVAEGEVVAAWFEARDNFVRGDGTPTPQVGRSAHLYLTRKAAVATEATEPSSQPALAAPADTRAAGTGRAAGRGDRSDGGSPSASGDDADRATAGGGSGEGENVPGKQADGQGGGAAGYGAAVDAGGPVQGDPEARREFVEALRGFVETFGREIDSAAQAAGRAETDDASAPQRQGGGASEKPDSGTGESTGGASDAAQTQPTSSAPAAGERSTPSEPGTDDERLSAAAQTQPARRVSVEDAAAPDGGAPEPAEDRPQRATAEEPAASSPSVGRDEPRNRGGDAEEKPERRPSVPEAGADDGKSQPDASGEQPAADSAESRPADESQRAPSETETLDNVPAEPGGEDGQTAIPLPGASERSEPPASASPLDSQVGADEGADTRGAGEFVDALELLARAGELNENDLVAVGWPEQRAGQFVRDLNRLESLARRAALLGEVRRWLAPPTPGESGASVSGVFADERVRWLLSELSSMPIRADAIAPPADQQVESELQAVLNAYYRAMASKRGAQESVGRGRQP